MSQLRKIAKTQARRDIAPSRVPDPGNLAGAVAAWIAGQSGMTFIAEVPVHLVGCREGILVGFQAQIGDGFPTWVFQRLDDSFLRRLVDPYASVYWEWLRGKPWQHRFDDALTFLERELAGSRDVHRIDGIAAVRLDPETMQPLQSLLVDSSYIETLCHGKRLPAAPLIVAGSGGAAIVLLYEKAPKQNTMRAERIPAEECERLGLDAVDGPPIDELLGKLITHVRERLAWPGPTSTPHIEV